MDELPVAHGIKSEPQNMLKVIAYTGGHNAPSSISRVQNYVAPLRRMGVELLECPSRAGLYPPANRWRRPYWGLRNVTSRFPEAIRSYRYELTLFQREMLSTFVTWEPVTRRPRVLDVDDAIWAHRRGRFAERLARLCDHVVCGNQFLANEFSRWNPSVSVLPTPVDASFYVPGTKASGSGRPIIGWSGLYTGFPYLYAIEGALREVLRKHPEAVLRIVSDRRPELGSLPAGQYEHVTWTPENQVRTIQEMTIGIMPLDQSVLAQGKCSFKMLLYMACGIPVVVSPVGMNADVLRKGNVGFGPTSEGEWIHSLSELLRNPELRLQMGRTGRETVLQHYSVDALAPKLADTLLRVAGRPA